MVAMVEENHAAGAMDTPAAQLAGMCGIDQVVLTRVQYQDRIRIAGKLALVIESFVAGDFEGIPADAEFGWVDAHQQPLQYICYRTLKNQATGCRKATYPLERENASDRAAVDDYLWIADVGAGQVIMKDTDIIQQVSQKWL